MSYLGSGYIVKASIGHVRDLTSNCVPKPDDNFEPTYEITKDKKKVVAGLRKAAKEADEIIIASDGDREGEAIAYHLVQVLNANDYKRIVFHEITKTAIARAIEEPRKVDMNMFNSQQTRRILDRIVGYKLSPILKTVNGIQSKSLGAGRVQSVVTRLIVDKEKEIEQFMGNENESKFHVSGDFTINEHKFKGTYIDKQIEKSDIKNIAVNIRDDPNFFITNVTITERLRYSPPPFITSNLQQESSYKLKFQLKKTMMLAQKLYEKGLITYMRTDSPALSNEALGSIKKHILEDVGLGNEYYQFRQFKAKDQNAQEAHEAIRPTHFNVYNLTDYDLEGSDEEKLYQLIWNRSVASQIKPAKYQDQHITLSNTKKNIFEGTNSILIFDGYLKLYKEKENEDDDNEENKYIKLNDQDLKKNEVKWSKICFKETYVSPPTRYNEPSLVKKLETLGIGRPSTYANIISKLQEHKYIKTGNIEGTEKQITTFMLEYKCDSDSIFTKSLSKQKFGGERYRLIPTNDGIIITNYLVEHFPQIMDYQFTAHMETLLDDIANGKIIWCDVLNEFYKILKEQFTKLNLDINNLKISVCNKNENNDESADADEEDNNSVKENKEDKEDKQENKKTSIVIGKHPKYGDILYMHAKFGPVFMINLGSKLNRALFVSAGKLSPNDTKIEEFAIKYIDFKLKKSKEEKQSGAYTKIKKTKYYKK